MSAIRKRIPTPVKMIVAILSPIIITVVAFYIYGLQVRNTEHIYPHISIAGIEVSGFTREEAMLSLGLPAYDERGTNANVSIIFPDDSRMVISGNDVNLKHNARDIVIEAYSVGRGRGVILDAVSYLQRLEADEIFFNIDFALDEAVLSAKVAEFTNDYNNRLNASVPAIYEDSIVFTKGAGHVNADVEEIHELAYHGLFESLGREEPVEIHYYMLETSKTVFDIFDKQKDIFVQMVSSGYDPGTDAASESVIGIDFDAIEAVRLINELESGQSVTLPIIYTHPEYSQEQLDELLFRDLIGQRTTWAHGNANRLNNIELSSGAINGLVLMPGDEFSFNGVVGARTLERGYKYAPALSRGETIMSVGGGVCQTSSTLYAAIRLTDLNVTEQQRHGKPVPYLPWGHDATVFYPYLDFKFVNNTNYPLRIEMDLDDRYVTARVWGTIIDDFPIAADWNAA